MFNFTSERLEGKGVERPRFSTSNSGSVREPRISVNTFNRRSVPVFLDPSLGLSLVRCLEFLYVVNDEETTSNTY